jgi:WhiB family transcriptional regulator, redox-sensing transcriptional regulator
MPGITIPLPPGAARAWAATLGETHPPAWMLRGACRGADTELFFPVATAGRAREQISSAKSVCISCAVRARCLSYALKTVQHGIWGGTTEDERIAMHSRSAGVR